VVAACGIFCCGFSSSWSGVELRVMRPVCRMLVTKHITVLEHSAYSPDLAPSDFFLFLKIKEIIK